MRASLLPQPANTSSPSTVTATAGNARDAGPDVTCPFVALNLLPWHGQRICPPFTSVTWQPWCVHVAENACTVPASSRVTTTSCFDNTTPPPTGTDASVVNRLRPGVLP